MPMVLLHLATHHDANCSKELDGKQGDDYSQGRSCPVYNATKYHVAYGRVFKCQKAL